VTLTLRMSPADTLRLHSYASPSVVRDGGWRYMALALYQGLVNDATGGTAMLSRQAHIERCVAQSMQGDGGYQNLLNRCEPTLHLDDGRIVRGWPHVRAFVQGVKAQRESQQMTLELEVVDATTYA
jgi:hypothetical protein